tara:strand:- start:464 stop:634 length:171 start_codon:yes stop_codon:yes gene_type:complete
MNAMGEDMLNTSEQAYGMIVKTDMDYLLMGKLSSFKKGLKCQYKYLTKNNLHFLYS